MILSKLVEHFGAVAKEAQTLTFITRDRGLQEQARQDIATLLELLAAEKNGFVAAGDEDSANQILALECAIRSVDSELAMFLDLKDDQPERAWNHLVDAQNAASASMRAHESAVHVERHAAKLHYVEKLLFPPQVFMSVGCKVGRRECTICNSDYEDCDHIVGRPYMGSMCSVILQEIELHEASIVTDPADKRCRVTHFSDEGGQRNKMTWALEPPDSQKDAV